MSSISPSEKFDIVQQHQGRVLKHLNQKLTPLSESIKYPMGRSCFLDFKMLQKNPKLKKQHFEIKRKKLQIEAALLDNLINKELQTQQKNFGQKAYHRPQNWMKLWRSTGQNFQRQLLSKDETLKSTSFSTSRDFSFLKIDEFSASFRRLESKKFKEINKSILKKAQYYKQFKENQLNNSKKPKKQVFPSLHHSPTCRNPQPQSEALQSSFQKENFFKSPEVQFVDQLSTKSGNQDWVAFITTFIFKNYAPDTKNQKLEEIATRRQDNKLKDFIKIFETKTQNFQRDPDGSLRSKTLRAKKQTQFCEQDELPVNSKMKLKKLQSLCKQIQLEPQTEKKDNCFYSCTKLRINSNHKRIIEVNRNCKN